MPTALKQSSLAVSKIESQLLLATCAKDVEKALRIGQSNHRVRDFNLMAGYLLKREIDDLKISLDVV